MTCSVLPLEACGPELTVDENKREENRRCLERTPGVHTWETLVEREGSRALLPHEVETLCCLF